MTEEEERILGDIILEMSFIKWPTWIQAIAKKNKKKWEKLETSFERRSAILIIAKQYINKQLGEHLVPADYLTVTEEKEL